MLVRDLDMLLPLLWPAPLAAFITELDRLRLALLVRAVALEEYQRF